MPPPSRPAGGGRDRLIPLRPLRVGELLDAAFRLVRANAAQLVLLTLSTVGMLTLLQQVVIPAAVLAPEPGATPAELLSQLGSGGTVGGLLITGLLSLVLTPIVNGGVTAMGVAMDRGEEATWRSGLLFGLRRFWPLLGTALLAGLLLVVGVVVLGVAVVVLVVGAANVSGVLAVLVGVGAGVAALAVGIALYAALFVAIPVAVVEGVGPGRAVSRSFALLRPQLPRTVGLVLLAGLLVGIVSTVAGVAALPFQFAGGPAARVGAGLIAAVVQSVVVPFQAFIALLIYTDARVRREGLDVAVLTAELDSA
jgi:hypothetical protein